MQIRDQRRDLHWPLLSTTPNSFIIYKVIRIKKNKERNRGTIQVIRTYEIEYGKSEKCTSSDNKYRNYQGLYMF